MTKIIYTLEFQKNSSFFTDKTLQEKEQEKEHYSTLKNPSSNTPQETTSAINVQTTSPSITHSPQVILFYGTSFFKYKNYFQGFFQPDD